MTPKEALDFLVKNLPVEAQQTTSIYHTAIRVLLQSLTERDIYYQALCDIESGKDVRMILERVLT